MFINGRHLLFIRQWIEYLKPEHSIINIHTAVFHRTTRKHFVVRFLCRIFLNVPRRAFAKCSLSIYESFLFFFYNYNGIERMQITQQWGLETELSLSSIYCNFFHWTSFRCDNHLNNPIVWECRSHI